MCQINLQTITDNPRHPQTTPMLKLLTTDNNSDRQHSHRQHSHRQHSHRQHSHRHHSHRQHSHRQYSHRQHSHSDIFILSPSIQSYYLFYSTVLCVCSCAIEAILSIRHPVGLELLRLISGFR